MINFLSKLLVDFNQSINELMLITKKKIKELILKTQLKIIFFNYYLFKF